MPKITINKNTGTDYKVFSEIFYKLEHAAKLDVAGNLSVGGNTIVCGEIQTDNITIKNSGALDLSGNLTVSNNVDISGNLGVVGDASFCNIVYVDSIAEKTMGSNITFLNDVDISGNITLEDIDISGNATICGDLYIDDIGEKTPGIGLAIHNNTDISGNLVVAGGLEVFQDASYCGVVYTNYLDDKTDGSGITINTNIDVSGNVCANELLVDTISSKTGNGVCITNTFIHAYDTENQNNMNFSTTNTTNDTISSISDTSDNQGAIGVNTIDFRTVILPWVCEMYVEQFTADNLFIGLIESTFTTSSTETVLGKESYYINCGNANDTLTGSWSKEVIATAPITLDTDISGNDTSKGYRFTVNSDSSGYNLTLEFTDNSGSSWTVVNDDASGLPISILIDETKKYKIFSWDQSGTSSSIGTRVSGSYDSYGLRVDTIKSKSGSSINIDSSVCISGKINATSFQTVSQDTSGCPGVEINAVRGYITMFEALNDGSECVIDVSNNCVSPTSSIMLTLGNSPGDLGNATVNLSVDVSSITDGFFQIVTSNKSGTNTSQPLIIQFLVIG